MKRDRMEALAQLAALRAQRSAAQLAARQAIVTELGRRDAALRAPVGDGAADADAAALDLGMLAAQDRHDRWRTDQLGRISIALARANAAAQPFRDAHARDVAREKVVARLRRGR